MLQPNIRFALDPKRLNPFGLSFRVLQLNSSLTAPLPLRCESCAKVPCAASRCRAKTQSEAGGAFQTPDHFPVTVPSASKKLKQYAERVGCLEFLILIDHPANTGYLGSSHTAITLCQNLEDKTGSRMPSSRAQPG